MRFVLVVLALVVAGCATQQPQLAGWSVDQCAALDGEVVNFKKPDGSPLAVAERRTCVLVLEAAGKIQTAAGFEKSRLWILAEEQPNAFATRDAEGRPVVVLTAGMLQAIGADGDAWAGLLGHEIAHHVQRHAAERESAQTTARTAGTATANLISLAVPGVGGAVGGAVGGTLTQSAVYGAYTRPQEAEADELALKWMTAAGYDARGLLRLFSILAKRSSMPAFLSTHPASEDRVQAVEVFIAKRGKLP